jgi:hypothetical protein
MEIPMQYKLVRKHQFLEKLKTRPEYRGHTRSTHSFPDQKDSQAYIYPTAPLSQFGESETMEGQEGM